MTVRPITIDFETESHNIITDIKHGKGNFTYRIDDESQSSQVISLPEINNSIYLDLYIQYYWTNSSGSNNSSNNNYNTCNLKLNWMPRYSDNKEYINELSPEFNQTNNNIKIQFNDESPISINKSLKISDPESEPGWQGQVSFDGSESKRNIEIRFTYEYTNNGVTYYISGLNDTYSLKIFPPSSKYARNVVFNEEGINELVGYFKQYPITKLENGEKYGHIKITKGINEKSEISPKGLESSTENSLLCSTDFIPSEDNNFNLGSDKVITYTYSEKTTFEASDHLTEFFYKDNNNNYKYIGTLDSGTFYDYQHQYGTLYTRTENIDDSIPTQRWKNLYLSDTAYANEFKGALTGLPNGLTGDSININDKFIVDNEGNVHMAGNITWGKQTNSSILTIYHHGDIREKKNNVTGKVTQVIYIPPDPPEENMSYFPENDADDGSYLWHTIYNENKDFWVSFSYNNGSTWSAPIRVGEDINLPEMMTAEDLDILGYLQEHKDEQGILSFDNGKIGMNLSALRTSVLETNSIIMNPTWYKDYVQGNASLFSGGFISFIVPPPKDFSTPNVSTFRDAYDAIAAQGWMGRLGYLHGDGTTNDNAGGKQDTVGLGLALYTKAGYKDIHGISSTPNEDNKYHLLLARLLLTDAGFSLTLRGSAADPNWYYSDSDGPKYYLRWWTAQNESTKDGTEKHQPIAQRLWMHEDTGKVYFRQNNGWVPR